MKLTAEILKNIIFIIISSYTGLNFITQYDEVTVLFSKRRQERPDHSRKNFGM